MANTFKSNLIKNVGTSPATVYTCPLATQTTLIGLSVANTTTSPITTDVYITRSAVNYYLIEAAVVPVGGSLVVVGGEQKVVLQPSDVLVALTSAASSADVVCSLLEITP
jgi:hypothetical protein